MSRKLNPNAQDFITDAEKYSKRPFNRKAEVIAIYEAAVDTDQVDAYRELCFTAKYLMGLMRVIKDGSNHPKVNSVEYVKKDFSENMLKLINQIRQIISSAPEARKKYFEEEFFEKSHYALSNLNELLADLENVKLYMNYLKRDISGN